MIRELGEICRNCGYARVFHINEHCPEYVEPPIWRSHGCLETTFSEVPTPPDLTKELAEAQAKIAKLREAAIAFEELTVCYRIGKRPTEKLFKAIEKAKITIIETAQKETI